MVNVRLRKSGLPMIAAMMGITRLLTSELTTAANARPMTNATASSTMLPLKRKSLNSLIMVAPSLADPGHIQPTTPLTKGHSEGVAHPMLATPFGLIAESQGHYDEAEYNRRLEYGVDIP